MASCAGTGKTITMKVMAESFSDMGVPVFMADVKGDVSGMCVPGAGSADMRGRIERFGIEGFEYKSYPTRFWDIFGEQGHPVRVTISDMGPVLIARLLGLTEPVRAMVEDGRLSAGHARALLTLGSKQQQAAAETVVKDALSVRQTELLVKKLTAEKKEKPQKDALSVNYVEEAARELGEKLGRPRLAAQERSDKIGRTCRIVSGKKKGRIELEYYGTEDLNALLEALEKLGKR